MKIEDILLAMISVIIYDLQLGWVAHWYGCKFADDTWDKPADRQAAIELLAEALDVSLDKADAIVRAFAHGDYGM